MAASAVERLAQAVGEVVGTRAGVPVRLERPSDPRHGDYATNAALRLAPERRKAPRELAQEIADAAAKLPQIAGAEVAGPGFVNLRVTDTWLGEVLAEMLATGRDYGGRSAATPEHVQVEMVSANPTGPIPVSAARNGAYGDAVARLLAFTGHRVEREYYYNDAGRQIELFRASVQARRRGESVPEDGYKGGYIDELAQLESDPVAEMLRQIEVTLERFRVHFDSWALQSRLEEKLPDLLPRLDTYEREGAVYARSSAYGDDADWVLIRSAEKGGLPTYRAADVAYVHDKLERGFDRALYVLGADHHSTAKWYPAIARMLGYDPERVEVLLYQFVHLTRGGQAAKMSKRSGDIVTLDELMDEIGVDAARWYLVNRGPDQTIEIDIDLAAEKTQKNPVYYVQYAHARIAGILRNAGGAAVSALPVGALSVEERELIKRLAEFPEVVAEAAARRAPHAITTHAIRIADDFHRFYQENLVLGSDEQAVRLGLVTAAQHVIARALDLVGVEAPERM
ncbi:MAG TPA: arginine--tRNA ligase [Gaiellaceae bacterium]|nr:arginine--tRNA ligase [Gaiellaceae bacterium]